MMSRFSFPARPGNSLQAEQDSLLGVPGAAANETMYRYTGVFAKQNFINL